MHIEFNRTLMLREEPWRKPAAVEAKESPHWAGFLWSRFGGNRSLARASDYALRTDLGQFRKLLLRPLPFPPQSSFLI